MVKQDNPLRLFGPVVKANFLNRLNRFLITCNLNGEAVSAFLPNPGRLQELLLPGRPILLVKDEGPKDRKTSYTAVGVLRDGLPIMLHTHKTNEVARYLLQKGKIPGLKGTQIVQSEVQMGRSRFDFLLRKGRKRILLEVKSCTLVGERVAMFPDAVTERGRRHMMELAEYADRGMVAAVLFLVHWPHARVFMPDYHTDLGFSKVLLSVRNKVKVIPLSIRWQEDLSLSTKTHRLQIPWSFIEKETKDQGSYLLILELKRGRNILIGKLGSQWLEKGFYIYVGSAMSHLSRRIERHRRLRKKFHWHIDALRAKATFHSALAIRASVRLECEIADALSQICEWSISGFGCSDCSCPTHLFAMKENPLHAEKFLKLLQYFRMDRLAFY